MAAILPPPLQSFSLDNLQAPISKDDVELLLPMFRKEEIQALWALKQMQALPRFARSRSCAPKQMQPSPWFARSRSVNQACSKRKYPQWPSCISADDDEHEVTVTSPPSPPPIKRARSKSRSRRRDDARAFRVHLRKWHNEIATRILRRQHRAPELSRGGTALGCRCHELAQGAGAEDDEAPRGCALHQEEKQPGDRAWMYTARGRLPLVGGPGAVLVPTMSAGNSKATVLQYQRWRRGVQMPSRFYVEHAVQQGLAAAAAERRQEGDWMMTD